MMKHSFRRQVTILFSTVMIGTLVLCFIGSALFLERYYITDKKTVIKEAYEMINTAVSENSMSDETFQENFENYSVTNNISVLVMSLDQRVMMYSTREIERLQFQLWNYLFDRERKENTTVLEETDHYVLRQNKELMGKMEYLEIIGTLDSGDYFIIRTPLESIRDSVAVANRFYLYIVCVVIMFSALLIYFFSRKITKPILELADISRRMTALDFDAKFECRVVNEIGVLGHHMNQLSETLEHTISELKTANNELRRDIEQKEKNEEMRKEFLSNVSHELKTPLALIGGYAEGLKEAVNDDEESRNFYCEVIMDEADKMNSMVKKLLTLNELEFGKDTVQMERFNITELVRGVIESTSLLLKQKEGRICLQAEENVDAWGDELKVEEVITNYLSNAYHHLEGERLIEVKIEKKEERVRVSVFNTGKQIPEEDIDRIWEKFYKVDKAHTREYGGNGIGLSIVKAIMESMNGSYGVNNYNNGVEFWFEL
ncbi:MAG: sensor histidine kinase [Lachnospiraceae bacterium]